MGEREALEAQLVALSCRTEKLEAELEVVEDERACVSAALLELDGILAAQDPWAWVESLPVREQRLFRYLLENGTSTSSEIHNWAGVGTRQNTHEGLMHLMRAGHVVRVGLGIYRAVDCELA